METKKPKLTINKHSREFEYTHNDITIRQYYDVLGKHVEACINRNDYVEHIDPSDERASEAFIAMMNYKIANRISHDLL